MSIIIGADIVPTKTNYDLFEKADIKALFGEELLKVLSDANFRIFNMETPISDTKSPIKKCGPTFCAPERIMPGIKALGVNLLAVANNHILDQNEQGLSRTGELLEQNGIDLVGAGKDLDSASKPYIFEMNGKKIGVYACVEHEFSVATKTSGGANPFDPFESFDHVSNLKAQCDRVIVLYHGGKEHYRYPSPNLQKTCRKFVDKGADVVLCQHSHCIGCEEKYNEGTILYGQGNFIFDGRNEFWQTGFLVRITDDFQIEYIPLKRVENGVRVALFDEGEKILADFNKRSEEIKEDGFVEAAYRNFVKENLNFYILMVSGKTAGFLFSVMNKLSGGKLMGWYCRNRYKEGKKYIAKNFIECESVRELLLSGFDIMMEE